MEDEERSDHGSSFARVQLPEMSRENSEPERPDPIDRSSSPSRSSYGNGQKNSYQASSRASAGTGSPMPLTPAQILDPPAESGSESRSLAMSPTRGRISPERLDRPASPTKGMGGFVQSAMMKRSDSVSKRWSVQSPPTLNGGSSGASNRSSQDLISGISPGSIISAPSSETKPKSGLSRENSPRPNSRPTSSHSFATVTQEGPGTSTSMRSGLTASIIDDGFVKPAARASRPHGVGSVPGQGDDRVDIPIRVETPPPTSPSKTMDQKRWSPTKSSWLESALNKPGSPKPKPAPPPQQPAWMAEINKAKQKGSADLGSGLTAGPKHSVSIGGLLRSPPMGGPAKPSSIGGLPAGLSARTATKNRPENNTSSPEGKDNLKIDFTDANPSAPTMATKLLSATGNVKPEIPMKKDFRANLKPRQVASDSNGPNEPEFKNVFGQLRSTKTQNYVAPDDLKDNITRGKAALNITGGPKKNARVDEFKDAILKKKSDFERAKTDGKGVTRTVSGGSQDAPLPEALAKQKALGRSNFIVAAETSNLSSDTSSRHRAFADSSTPTASKEMSLPGRLQGKEPVVGKLAGRLNPSLAGILARGPPSIATEGSRSSSPVASQRTVSIGTSTTTLEAVETGPQLNHMTKGRARGPRRKAPSSVPSTALSDPTSRETKEISPLETPSSYKTQANAKSAMSAQDSVQGGDAENQASQPSSPRKLDIKRLSQFLQEVPTKLANAETQLDPPKPHSPTKANEPEVPVKARLEMKAAPTPAQKPKPINTIGSTSLIESSDAKRPVMSPEDGRLRHAPLSPSKAENRDVQSNKAKISLGDRVKTLTSTNDQANGQGNAVNCDSVVSVKNATALWDRPSPNNSFQASARTKSPIRLPTQADEEAAMVCAGLPPASPTNGNRPISLGIQSIRKSNSARPIPITSARVPLSPPPSAGFMPSKDTSKSTESLVSQTSEASRLVSEFFVDRQATKFKVDTAALLSARPDQGLDIKTLRSNLYQLSSDGKKQPVPSHQERVLFEGNLYVCTHIFGRSTTSRIAEVYFWLGDQVPDTVVEEATMFAQREAKSAGCRLVTIRQGKETPEFLHALGGIIIIRRGTSNKYDSLAPHILCCRKHFGQIVFDEVDFSPSSLCSGFPYLISTQSGKAYLWRGKGSGIDELSCARLIGMDFGLTGEIEEIEDGNEPASFISIFGNGATIPKSADHWRIKSNCTKYCGRLYRADSVAKEQVGNLNRL